jgi:hypothetical protein
MEAALADERNLASSIRVLILPRPSRAQSPARWGERLNFAPKFFLELGM